MNKAMEANYDSYHIFLKYKTLLRKI